MNDLTSVIPESRHLQELLPEIYSEELEEILKRSLLSPVADFLQHPGKNLRPLLVEVGHRLSFEHEPQIDLETKRKILQASAIIELIHNGSLIVDDIQDGSEERRNGPCFHVKHGVPLALNAGNWLYFRALCLIKDLDLDPVGSTDLMSDLLDLMGKAHLGQAIDLGTRISDLPSEQIKDTCHASMELKTGTLMSMALRLGMAIAGNSSRKDEVLDLGRRMGILLQMFDDVGNFCTENSKQFEDIINRRPSWVWAKLSELEPHSYNAFIKAAEDLPHRGLMNTWDAKTGFSDWILKEAREQLELSFSDWEMRWSSTHPESLKLLNYFKTILESSYVKKA